jgi:hypothetical protein
MQQIIQPNEQASLAIIPQTYVCEVLGSRLGNDPAIMSVIFLTLTLSKVRNLDQATTTSLHIIISKLFLLSILLSLDTVSSSALTESLK